MFDVDANFRRKGKRSPVTNKNWLVEIPRVTDIAKKPSEWAPDSPEILECLSELAYGEFYEAKYLGSRTWKMTIKNREGVEELSKEIDDGLLWYRMMECLPISIAEELNSRQRSLTSSSSLRKAIRLIIKKEMPKILGELYRGSSKVAEDFDMEETAANKFKNPKDGTLGPIYLAMERAHQSERAKREDAKRRAQRSGLKEEGPAVTATKAMAK